MLCPIRSVAEGFAATGELTLVRLFASVRSANKFHHLASIRQLSSSLQTLNEFSDSLSASKLYGILRTVTKINFKNSLKAKACELTVHL